MQKANNIESTPALKETLTRLYRMQRIKSKFTEISPAEVVKLKNEIV